MTQRLGAPCRSQLGSLIQSRTGSAVSCNDGPHPGIILAIARNSSDSVLGDIGFVIQELGSLPLLARAISGVITDNQIVSLPVLQFTVPGPVGGSAKLRVKISSVMDAFDSMWPKVAQRRSSVEFVALLMQKTPDIILVNDLGEELVSGLLILQAQLGAFFVTAQALNGIVAERITLSRTYDIVGVGIRRFGTFVQNIIDAEP